MITPPPLSPTTSDKYLALEISLEFRLELRISHPPLMYGSVVLFLLVSYARCPPPRSQNQSSGTFLIISTNFGSNTNSCVTTPPSMDVAVVASLAEHSKSAESLQPETENTRAICTMEHDWSLLYHLGRDIKKEAHMVLLVFSGIQRVWGCIIQHLLNGHTD